jgi:hypothetical protein
VVRIRLNNKQQTIGLGHQHVDTIQLKSPVGLGHQQGITLTADTECPNKHRQRQPHTRAHKTAKGHRCQARMQSIQQLRLPKAADRRTKRKADRQPKAKGLNRSSLSGSRHRAAPTSNLDPPPCLRFLPDLRNILDHEEGRFASCYRCRATSSNIASPTSRCKTPTSTRIPGAEKRSNNQRQSRGRDKLQKRRLQKGNDVTVMPPSHVCDGPGFHPRKIALGM